MSFGKVARLYTLDINATIDGRFNSSTGSVSSSSSNGYFSPKYWVASSMFILSGNAAGTVQTTSAVNLYLLALHNNSMTSAAIAANYAKGLPRSIPVPVSAKVSVQEDGEVGNHATQPAFYSAPIPTSQLAIINLRIVDIDDTPASPNYNPVIGPRSVAVITSLPPPTLCQFYYLNGTALSTAASAHATIHYSSVTQSYPIRIRPAYNTYSRNLSTPFCTLRFAALDPVSGQLSPTTATVSMVVTRVDKPPIAKKNLNSTVYASKLTVLVLRGQSFDSPSAGAFLRSLPAHGLLYVVYKNLTVSKTPIVFARNQTEFRLPNVSLACVAYRSTSSQTLLAAHSLDGFLFHDSFTFSVVDMQNRQSIPTSYTLRVMSAISVVPSTRLCSQHVLSPVVLTATDSSSLNRNLTVKIISLPTSGVLYRYSRPSNLSSPLIPLNVNDVLPSVMSYPYRTGVTIYYLGGVTYFNTPSVRSNGSKLSVAPDSFRFQAMTALSPASPIAAQSAIGIQSLRVQNINQPTQITLALVASYNSTSTATLPSNSVTVFAFTAASGLGDAALYPMSAVISGFRLTDTDLGVGLIRATVSTSTPRGGLVSLNSHQLDQVFFNSKAFCFSMSRWQCRGDGYEDTVSTFVGTPAAIAAVLNGMQYSNPNPNVIDIVNITLSDGEGGNCLDNSLQSAGSLRYGCFSRSVSFVVTVLDYPPVVPKGGASVVGIVSAVIADLR